MKIGFFGAARQVTGSNYYIESGNYKFLIDCGQFQGTAQIETQNFKPLGYDPKEIDFIILTHAHIDHSGRLPLLYKNGFRGKIFCTQPTNALCEILLMDSASIQEETANFKSSKNKKAGLEKIDAFFTKYDAENTLTYFYSVAYGRTFEVNDFVSFRFIDAGHLLGSASIELWVKENNETKKLVFSGDIGSGNNVFLPNPVKIESADILITESTYGNRNHTNVANRGEQLFNHINETLSNGGTVLIPAFAVGRTQEALFEIRHYFESNGLKNDFSKIPIYIDTPMGSKATVVYEKYKNHFRDDIKKYFIDESYLRAENVYYVDTNDESYFLDRSSDPKIIISASGMCEGGRIRHHLAAYLPREDSKVIFIGYQGEETLGREIKEGVKKVYIDGENVSIKSEIIYIDGFSGHGDKDMLFKRISDITTTPKLIFACHGDEPDIDKFAESLRDTFKTKVIIPEMEEIIEI